MLLVMVDVLFESAVVFGLLLLFQECVLLDTRLVKLVEIINVTNHGAGFAGIITSIARRLGREILKSAP